MNGETESPTSPTSANNESSTSTRNKFELKQNALDAFETSLGLPKLNLEEDECEYVEMSPEEILKMDWDGCSKVAAGLSNYGIYIQRILNKQKSYLNYIESKINMMIANELNSYEGYYSQEQRRAVAIVNNSYAKEWELMRMNHKMKVDLLDGLVYQINQKIRIVSDIQNGKHKLLTGSNINPNRY